MRGFVVALALLATSAASAESTKADLLFDEGRALMDAGKYADACDKFSAAIQLDPESPGTMLNLGLCNEKLNKIAEALTWYKKAEEHARTYKMTENENAANEKARALEPRVPVVKIEFESELPPGGQVMFDGKPLRSEDYARFVADPGKHELVITAPHVRRFDQTLELVEGGEKTVKVDKWVETHTMTRDAGRGRRHLAYYVAGGALALYAADLAIGLRYKSDFRDQQCSATVHTPQCNSDDHTVKVWSTTTFVAGTAAAAAAVYLYLSAPKAETYEAWLPIVSKDGVGIAYDRRF